MTREVIQKTIRQGNITSRDVIIALNAQNIPDKSELLLLINTEIIHYLCGEITHRHIADIIELGNYKFSDILSALRIENIKPNPYHSLIKEVFSYKIYGLKRGAIYHVDDILPHIGKGRYASFDGDTIRINSLRYKTFRDKGIVCAHCGLAATFFAKEMHRNCTATRYHFNLYGIDSNGCERLYTHDHIIPLAKGGRDHIDNTQTMCLLCNNKKGDQM